MELRTLYYFTTLAREKNISRAAEKLFLTQPTLSRQLKQLEDYLGTELFIRGSRQIVLTEAGQLLLRRAEEILHIVEQTERDLFEGSDHITGRLMIGLLESAATHAIIPHVLQQLTATHPGITFEFYTGNTYIIQERIQNGLLDVGFLIDPIESDLYEFLHLPFRDRWGLIMNHDSPLARLERIALEDLCEVPLIYPKRIFTRNELNSWFQNSFNELHMLSSYNILSNVISLVEAGIGHCIGFEGSLYNFTKDKVKFVRFTPEIQPRILLAWKKHRNPTPALTKFLQLVEQRLQDIEALDNPEQALPFERTAQGNYRVRETEQETDLTNSRLGAWLFAREQRD